MVKQVFRHRDSVQRQQVRRVELGGLVGWFLHLRAGRREDRSAAAGLLPHQCREHGPVRADADHLRARLLRSLRRRLHRADLQHGFSLHSAVVEIIVQEGARCRYTTIQNWSKNVYNLVTKRAVAYKNATMEWVDGNLGSKLTMKYPAVWLMEPGRSRRDPLGRVRRRRSAPGRRRQGRPRRAEHVIANHLEVDLEGHRPLVVPRSGEGL